ncbi:MAG: hypothetical protein PHR47_00965 [Candidatus Pacebacteria bacterium]|nr:hypothetical protein [Candidatus Paceibacterota bacterium]
MFANASPWYSETGEPISHLNKLILVRKIGCLEVAIQAKTLTDAEGNKKHGFIPCERNGSYYTIAEGVVRIHQENDEIIVEVGGKFFPCDRIIFEYTSLCNYWQEPKREVREPSPPKKKGWRKVLSILKRS